MKIPVPDEVKETLETTQRDMAAMRADIAEIRNLLDLLITVQYEINGLDRPTDL